MPLSGRGLFFFLLRGFSRLFAWWANYGGLWRDWHYAGLIEVHDQGNGKAHGQAGQEPNPSRQRPIAILVALGIFVVSCHLDALTSSRARTRPEAEGHLR